MADVDSNRHRNALSGLKASLGSVLLLICICIAAIPNAHATADSLGPVYRYKSVSDRNNGITTPLDAGFTAYVYDQAVEHLSYVHDPVDGEAVEERYIDPQGNIYSNVHTYSASKQCWLVNRKCAITTPDGLIWIGINMSAIITSADQLGLWHFKTLVNGTATFAQDFQIVSGHLRIVGGNPQTGKPNDVSTPMEVQLVENDGITPLDTHGEGIPYTITATPRIGNGDTAPYLSKDGLTGPAWTSAAAQEDVGGFAKMYLYYGSVEGQYQVTATSRYAPFEPQTFTLTASATGEGDPTDPKNLGKPDCVKGAGKAGSAARPAALSNPINITTGDKYQEETDFVMPQPALLKFVRHYNSLEGKLDALGWNWRHDYEQSIEVVTTGKGGSATQTAYVTRSDGRVYTYTDNNGAWVSDPDVTATLTQTASGWTVKENNVTETFDTAGKLLTIQQLDGRTVSLTYDAQTSRLSQVADDIGSSITFAYNAQGLISTITDQAGRQWQYGYDANDNLSSVTNPDSTVKTYRYDDLNFVHALTGITDERQIDFATYAYNADGKATTSYHAGNAGRVDIVYGANGARTVTNSRNITSTYGVITQQKTAPIFHRHRHH